MTRLRVTVGRARAGIAVFWALVVLSVLAVTTTAAAWQFTAARRAMENRLHKLQALWLARAGTELAATRLAADVEGYIGEEVEVVPDGPVRIAVEKDPARADAYRVKVEARYPASGPGTITHAVTRTATRRTDGGKVRVELTTEPEKEGSD